MHTESINIGYTKAHLVFIEVYTQRSQRVTLEFAEHHDVWHRVCRYVKLKGPPAAEKPLSMAGKLCDLT